MALNKVKADKIINIPSDRRSNVYCVVRKNHENIDTNKKERNLADESDIKILEVCLHETP